MSIFSEALKSLRKARGITQSKLAQDLGVGKSTISMYEVGAREPDFETMEMIADYFNVPMATFVQSSPDSHAIPADSFTYAMHNASRDLTEEDKEMLLEMAQRLRKMHQNRGG